VHGQRASLTAYATVLLTLRSLSRRVAIRSATWCNSSGDEFFGRSYTLQITVWFLRSTKKIASRRATKLHRVLRNRSSDLVLIACLGLLTVEFIQLLLEPHADSIGENRIGLLRISDHLPRWIRWSIGLRGTDRDHSASAADTPFSLHTSSPAEAPSAATAAASQIIKQLHRINDTLPRYAGGANECTRPEDHGHHPCLNEEQGIERVLRRMPEFRRRSDRRRQRLDGPNVRTSRTFGAQGSAGCSWIRPQLQNRSQRIGDIIVTWTGSQAILRTPFLSAGGLSPSRLSISAMLGSRQRS